ncbi:MAG: hypothetical protein RL381_542 [Actinomycetota bacterium]|jgi:thiosulfate dehydrogenase [quinone] large subunit
MNSIQSISRSAVTSWKSQSNPLRLLRVFLGATWVYAGWDKATDPGFLNESATNYIGTQLAAFAHNSPVGFILNHTLEHATFVGIFVMLSEFAIGFATLFYIAPSSAAFAGFSMATGLWLSSSFHTTPYFLASDSAYAVMWLTYLLLLIGNRRMPSLNADRRGVIRTATMGVFAVAASLLGKVFPKASAATNSSQKNSSSKATGKQIIKLADLKVGAAHNFTHSAQGIPAVLFRTKNGVFAYSAICTHEGCTVSYNSSSKSLKCPCHGAEFDPTNAGKVLRGPTNRALPKLKVAISGAWVVEA